MGAGYQELAELRVKCQLITLINQSQEHANKRVCQMVAEAAFVGPYLTKNVLAVFSTVQSNDIALLCLWASVGFVNYATAVPAWPCFKIIILEKINRGRL